MLLCSRPCSRCVFFFLMIRRPPRSTLDRSSAASDVYKRQVSSFRAAATCTRAILASHSPAPKRTRSTRSATNSVSYTHLRAHETVLDLVCRLLLENKKKTITKLHYSVLKHKPYISTDITVPAYTLYTHKSK